MLPFSGNPRTSPCVRPQFPVSENIRYRRARIQIWFQFFENGMTIYPILFSQWFLIHTHTHAHEYIYIHICIHIYIIYTYIHVHIHSYITRYLQLQLHIFNVAQCLEFIGVQSDKSVFGILEISHQPCNLPEVLLPKKCLSAHTASWGKKLPLC